jgi:hypothetical protein
MPELRDRVAAVGAELHELRKDAAIAGDEELLSVLREADRSLRAEARREHRRRVSDWRGKWKDIQLAIAQGQRWQRREPFPRIEIVSTNGMRATLPRDGAGTGKAQKISLEAARNWVHQMGAGPLSQPFCSVGFRPR